MPRVNSPKRVPEVIPPRLRAACKLNCLSFTQLQISPSYSHKSPEHNLYLENATQMFNDEDKSDADCAHDSSCQSQECTFAEAFGWKDTWQEVVH